MATSRPPADHFTILYFAAANTFTKKKSEFLPAPLQFSALYDTLEKQYPGIKDKVLGSCALTVNLEYVDLEDNAADATIKSGDEVAIIPPAPQSLLTALNEQLNRQSAGYYAELEDLRLNNNVIQAKMKQIEDSSKYLTKSLAENAESLAENARAIAVHDPLDPANLPAPIIQVAAYVLFLAMLWDSILLLTGTITYIEQLSLQVLGLDASYALGADFWSHWGIVIPVAYYLLYYQSVYLPLFVGWIFAFQHWITPLPPPRACSACNPSTDTPADKVMQDKPARTLEPLGKVKRKFFMASLGWLLSNAMGETILELDRLANLSLVKNIVAKYILRPLGLRVNASILFAYGYLFLTLFTWVISWAIAYCLTGPLLKYMGYDPSLPRTGETEQPPAEPRKLIIPAKQFNIPAVTTDARQIHCKCMAEQAVDDDDEYLTDVLIIHRSRRCEDHPESTSRVMAHCGACKAFWTEISGN